MRALIVAIGSDGDVEPFMALAQRLISVGHSVTIATSDRFVPRARALGITAVAVGPAWNEHETGVNFGKVLSKRNPLQQVGQVIDLMRDLQLAVLPELLPLAQDADVVLHAPITVVGAVVARKLGKPHVSVQLLPLVPGERYAPTGADMGRLLNRAMWTVTSTLLARVTDGPLNEVVRAAGLSPWRNILLEAARSNTLDLLAVSPQLMPRDPSWGPNTQVTGYWSVAEPDFKPDPKLESIVAQKPVVIGFGSMMGFDAVKVTERIVKAVKHLDRPVILQSGWARLGSGTLPGNVHVVGFVPHAWLFKHAACLVHHGGAGTIGAALRAGIPQAIVWHVGAMPVWDRKLVQLGVSPKARSHHNLTTPWLRRTIDRMLHDNAMQQRARELGQLVQQEDGPGEAVRLLEANITTSNTQSLTSQPSA